MITHTTADQYNAMKSYRNRLSTHKDGYNDGVIAKISSYIRAYDTRLKREEELGHLRRESTRGRYDHSRYSATLASLQRYAQLENEKYNEAHALVSVSGRGQFQ